MTDESGAEKEQQLKQFQNLGKLLEIISTSSDNNRKKYQKNWKKKTNERKLKLTYVTF